MVFDFFSPFFSHHRIHLTCKCKSIFFACNICIHSRNRSVIKCQHLIVLYFEKFHRSFLILPSFIFLHCYFRFFDFVMKFCWPNVALALSLLLRFSLYVLSWFYYNLLFALCRRGNGKNVRWLKKHPHTHTHTKYS